MDVDPALTVVIDVHVSIIDGPLDSRLDRAHAVGATGDPESARRKLNLDVAVGQLRIKASERQPAVVLCRRDNRPLQSASSGAESPGEPADESAHRIQQCRATRSGGVVGGHHSDPTPGEGFNFGSFRRAF